MKTALWSLLFISPIFIGAQTLEDYIKKGDSLFLAKNYYEAGVFYVRASQFPSGAVYANKMKDSCGKLQTLRIADLQRVSDAKRIIKSFDDSGAVLLFNSLGVPQGYKSLSGETIYYDSLPDRKHAQKIIAEVSKVTPADWKLYHKK